MAVPEYIAKQLRRSPPEDCCVVPDTLPQIGNGQLERAGIATVGINPRRARPAHYRPMDEGGMDREWDFKEHYFERRKYVYFTHLERILNACGASFGGKYDPEGRYAPAVSLDVVQWATDPYWARLPKEIKMRLLEHEKPFFTEILKNNPNIKLLLGNGKTVVKQVASLFDAYLLEVEAKDLGTRLYCGELLGRQFIGWSTFLSNSPLNSGQRAALAERVGELYSSGC